MKVHFLKCWPEYYIAITIGTKTFDLRFDDGRNYQAGDAVVFEEYHPADKIYSGLKVVRTISRIDKLKDLPGAQSSFAGSTGKDGWVILSLRRVDESDFMVYANNMRGAK